MAADRPVALVTSAGWYVGPAIARRLAPTHDLVLQLLGRQSDVAADLVPELEALGASVALPPSDANHGTADGMAAIVATALATFGRLDAACLITGTIIVGPFLSMTADQWEKEKTANLDQVFHGLQAVLPPMIAAKQGQVVVFTSATGARPEPGTSVYGATRAGANALVRAVGLEHAPDGVCVNAIGTNFMDFPGFLAASGADRSPERRARVEAQVPLRRLGTMDELAEFTAVLLDGRSRFQTGQFFSYSGGWST